ncbi:MAG: SDR family NAD(P)-dependent oxidoreductase [Siphonobacter sp.]
MKISIIGCGWLGLPLGEYLVLKGYDVTGTTTSPEKLSTLKQVGINPILLSFNPAPEGDLSGLLDAEVLIITIPPRAGKQGDPFYPKQFQYLLSMLSTYKGHVIHISSTSVYKDTNGSVTETDAVDVHHPIVQAEQVLKNSSLPLTILRCGGLLGYDRIPGKYFIGKTVNTGQIPVNFIHRNDVVEIILEVIRQNRWNETYNVVAPEHPVRKDVYLQNANVHGWAAPAFAEPAEPIPFKVISPEKLINQLHYSFLYPDPLYFK